MICKPLISLRFFNFFNSSCYFFIFKGKSYYFCPNSKRDGGLIIGDRLLTSEPKSIEVIKIRSTRTVFNFYLAISLSKGCIKYMVTLGSCIGFYKVNVNKTIKVGFKNIREKYG